MTDGGGRPGYDREQRQAAAALTREYPCWLVIWGLHSRRFWGFPLFSAQPGTIVSAASRTGLTARMQHLELTARSGGWRM